MAWRISILLLLAAGSRAARSEVYDVTYDPRAGLYPEQSGWVRFTEYGGDQRWFEDGNLVLSSLSNPGAVEYYVMYRPGALDPNSSAGEIFFISWGLRIDQCSYDYDIGIAVFAGTRWAVGFDIGYDTIYSAFETGVSATFAPAAFHDFCLLSADMLRYVLLVDGRPAIAGSFWESLWSSRVHWGDAIPSAASLSRWRYLRFGVAAPPGPGDMNCDVRVDFFDINPFVLALTDPQAYGSQYGYCNILNGDTNGDGRVDFDDINGFVALLSAVD
ncbi:MAG: hypothetical protein AB1716_10275 [Planctomycetota bacterium]